LSYSAANCFGRVDDQECIHEGIVDRPLQSVLFCAVLLIFRRRSIGCLFSRSWAADGTGWPSISAADAVVSVRRAMFFVLIRNSLVRFDGVYFGS